MILRIEVTPEGETCSWLYVAAREIFRSQGKSMAQVATELDKKLKSQWSQVSGIYVFLGPAGYSRLRATHAFALGISLAQQVPVAGYKVWHPRFAATPPPFSKAPLNPIYPPD